jgi:hypothetical protein
VPGPLTEQEREAFFAEPRVAVLSVSTGDASPPHATPVWYHYAPGGDVTFFTGTQGRTARKAALIERAGAVSLTVQRAEFLYRYATIQGSVVGADRPPTRSDCGPSSAATCPGRWPRRSSGRNWTTRPPASCSTRCGRSAG